MKWERSGMRQYDGTALTEFYFYYQVGYGPSQWIYKVLRQKQILHLYKNMRCISKTSSRILHWVLTFGLTSKPCPKPVIRILLIRAGSTWATSLPSLCGHSYQLFVSLILFPQWTSDKLDNDKPRPLLWLPRCWLLRSTYWPRQDNPQITNWVLPAPLTGPVLCLCFARTWTLHSLPVSFLTLVWTLLSYDSVRTLLFPGDSGSGLGYLLCPYWWAPFSMLYLVLHLPDLCI